MPMMNENTRAFIFYSASSCHGFLGLHPDSELPRTQDSLRQSSYGLLFVAVAIVVIRCDQSSLSLFLFLSHPSTHQPLTVPLSLLSIHPIWKILSVKSSQFTAQKVIRDLYKSSQ